jgi:aspartate-semialdehyde dehydrogenase
MHSRAGISSCGELPSRSEECSGLWWKDERKAICASIEGMLEMIKKKTAYRIAIADDTGAVGKEIVELLEDRNFPVEEIACYATEPSETERLQFKGKVVAVRELSRESFSETDIAFFSIGTEQSLAYAPHAVKSGAVVIDTSHAFSLDSETPLVIPDVNGQMLRNQRGIVACAGGPSAGLALLLKPLHDKNRVSRAGVTTFQSVAGSGKKAMEELAQQTVALLNFRDVETRVYPHQIAFNCIPQIGSFLDSGMTRVEFNLAAEIQKVLGDDTLKINATCVRVPVFRGTAASVVIEMEEPISVNEVRAVLAAMPGIVVYDDTDKNLYPIPIDIVGKDEVFVGRIREDVSRPNSVLLWYVFDDLRIGSSLNAVRIAEQLIR